MSNGLAHTLEDDESVRWNVCCNWPNAELCGQLGQYIVIPT
jgi:hypothetical protein